MSHKKGRPTSDPKTGQIRVRISDADKVKLRYCADHLQIKEAEVMRKGLYEIYENLGGNENEGN